MRAKTLALLTLIAFGVLFFAACGDDDDSGGAAASASNTPPAVATTATDAASETRPAQIGGEMILATTTSTQDSGLLDVLVPMFKDQTGVNVKVIAVGTGASLEMGAKGDADAVLVHAPASEKKYVDNGDLVEGQLVMHNDFVIVGPSADPAGIRGEKDLATTMQALAEAGGFISRGDDSGTHKKELELWKAADIDPATVNAREETGQGMGATLNVANQRQAYTLTDRGTFLALRDGFDLEVLFEGEKTLLNVYSVYLVNPEKHSAVKVEQARAWIAFLVAPETQALIGDFKKAEYGEPLFTPDAGKSLEDLGS
ncbi:MAG: substrate-binding domain-containing protein [Dehalococcoidia bacterium]|nr:substrate-binding domain-containing protein [Dehalococcoidia bacterium]